MDIDITNTDGVYCHECNNYHTAWYGVYTADLKTACCIALCGVIFVCVCFPYPTFPMMTTSW